MKYKYVDGNARVDGKKAWWKVRVLDKRIQHSDRIINKLHLKMGNHEASNATF